MARNVSAAQQQLDRKVRWILALLLLIIVLLIALPLRGYIQRAGESKVAGSNQSADERLVYINGAAALLTPDKLGSVITGWAKADRDKTLSFELSDRSFAAGSAALAPISLTRTEEIADATKANPDFAVHILRPALDEPPVTPQLNQQRALSLRDELLRRRSSFARYRRGRVQRSPNCEEPAPRAFPVEVALLNNTQLRRVTMSRSLRYSACRGERGAQTHEELERPQGHLVTRAAA
jgi:hypothetical protein